MATAGCYIRAKFHIVSAANRASRPRSGAKRAGGRCEPGAGAAAEWAWESPTERVRPSRLGRRGSVIGAQGIVPKRRGRTRNEILSAGRGGTRGAPREGLPDPSSLWARGCLFSARLRAESSEIMYYPTLAQAKTLAAQGNLLPVSRDGTADLR